MNKYELAKEIAGRMSTTVTEALRFIEIMNEVVGDSIVRSESVKIQNFGCYMPWKQSERMGRNPKTGERCPIRPRVTVKFKAGKGLIDKINGDQLI